MVATKQNKIRIGIDGGDFNPFDQARGGIQRLVGSFIKVIATQHFNNVEWFYYYFGKKAKSNHDPLYLKILPSRLFSSLFLPFHLLFDRVYLYLGFSGILPPFLRFFKKKSIVFIHDFGFYKHPEYYHDASKMRWQTEYAIFGSTKVIVFSDYIREQLFKLFPTVPQDKVVRIYPGVNHVLCHCERSEAIPSRLPRPRQGRVLAMTDRYFLYVGVIKPMKNIEELLRAFGAFLTVRKDKSYKLILIGTQEAAYFDSLQQTSAYKKVKDNMSFLTNITDEELIFYYQNCVALLNSSYEEGFCYPVIEALYLGKNVIVNDIPLYKEFAPFFKTLHITKNFEGFVEQMVFLSKTDNDADRAGKHPFQWERFTKEVLGVIESI